MTAENLLSFYDALPKKEKERFLGIIRLKEEETPPPQSKKKKIKRISDLDINDEKSVDAFVKMISKKRMTPQIKIPTGS